MLSTSTRYSGVFDRRWSLVVVRYTPDEARALKNQGELPEHAKINEGDGGEDEHDDNIEFGEVSDDDEMPQVQPQRTLRDLPPDDDSDLDIDDI